MFGLNRKQWKTRDKIIFGKDYKDEPYDVKSFKNLTLAQLEKLVDKDFVALDLTQNESPTIQEMMDFMKKHPGVTAHGYVVSHQREDYRTSLEGLSYNGTSSKQMIAAFKKFCKNADELILNSEKLYSWWD
jgi:hypothetical protein